MPTLLLISITSTATKPRTLAHITSTTPKVVSNVATHGPVCVGFHLELVIARVLMARAINLAVFLCLLDDGTAVCGS